MELLVQHSTLFTSMFKVLLVIFCFLFVIILVGYNALYLLRVLHSNRHAGIHSPKKLRHLIRTSIFLPLFTAIFILALLITGYY